LKRKVKRQKAKKLQIAQEAAILLATLVMRLSNLVPERRLIQFVVVSAGGFAITAAAAPFSPPLSGCVH
jgi:hypothetical protein